MPSSLIIIRNNISVKLYLVIKDLPTIIKEEVGCLGKGQCLTSPFDLRRNGKYTVAGLIVGVLLLLAVYNYDSASSNLDFVQFLKQSRTQSLLIVLVIVVPTLSGFFVGLGRARNKELKNQMSSLARERDKLIKQARLNKGKSSKLQGLLDQESGFFVDNWDELVTEKDKLREEAEVSSTLLQVALEIGGLADANEVLKMLSVSLSRALFADGCLSFIKATNGQGFVCLNDSAAKLDSVSSPAIKEMLEKQLPVAINRDDQNISINREVVARFGIKSAILIPCVKRDQVHAIAMVFYNKTAHDFNDRDIQIASGIVRSATIVLENADLYSEVIANHSQLQRVMTRLANAQEEERRRFARDLHDGVIQNLSGIIFSLSFLESSLTSEDKSAITEIKQIEKIVEDTIADLRLVIYDLRPTILDSLGLVPTLEKHLERFAEMNDIKTILNAQKQTRLPETVETALFRLAQEALNNIKKHAQASQVTLELSSDNEGVKMSVKDNGQGFSFESVKTQISNNSGFGLSGMRERVQSLHGDVEIISALGEGTSVNVRIPVTVKGA